uniref:Uncharacterized protein n=1 Tax=Oryza meridionalis TaxID=40149 RepID=A0A0E0FC45_9ORYZ
MMVMRWQGVAPSLSHPGSPPTTSKIPRTDVSALIPARMRGLVFSTSTSAEAAAGSRDGIHEARQQ